MNQWHNKKTVYAVLNTKQSQVYKLYKDGSQKQEIKDRQSRHQEREKEFDEIYKSVSENPEVSHFSKDFVETSESAGNEEEDNAGIIWKCCRKMCKFL